jgi:hypothetical protein
LADPVRVIAQDLLHSQDKERFFCFGHAEGWGILHEFDDQS